MFKSEIIEKNSELYNYIYGRTYTENKNISIEDLRYITIDYVDFNNKDQIGHLIANKDIVDDVIYIFKELYNNRYQLYSVKLIEEFWEKDGRTSDINSMHANNSSCFNYRNIEGKDYLSWHALGLAIDINPINNPYIINVEGELDYDRLTEEEKYYANNRSSNIDHVITHDDLAYKLFIERGFEWGGDWNPEKESIDYQHFEKHIGTNKKKL